MLVQRGTLASSPPGRPHIKAVKKSEHATEGESVVLTCKSTSFPPVTDWFWYKISESADQVRVRPRGEGGSRLHWGPKGPPACRSSPTPPRASSW